MDMGRFTVNQNFRGALTIRGLGASCGLANDGPEQGVGAISVRFTTPARRS